VWSADGTSVCYTTSRERGQRIVFQRLGEAAEPRLLRTNEAQFQVPTSFTPDGRTLVFSAIAATTQFDLWTIPLDGSAEPRPVVRSSSWETDGVVSPDGRWLAFGSDETGKQEVYVESFPVPGGRVRISTGGGASPQWTRDGKELLYMRQEQGGASIMSVAVDASGAFHPAMPRVLFRIAGLQAFSPTRDGERILISAETGVNPPPSISLILNWREQLQDR
jgi:eukaryotic-like serine/threonine-protein kinase